MKMFELVNRTDFKDKDIIEIANALCEGQIIPKFYLICKTMAHDGLTLTNLDKPTIIIDICDLHQFARVFVHELVHLQQHAEGYADHGFDADIIVTDKYKTKNECP